MKHEGTTELLRSLLLEMRAIRLIVAEAFDIEIEPSDLEEEEQEP